MMTTNSVNPVPGGTVRFWPPILPREHGAWMMLIVPMVVGALAGGPPSRYVILTFIAGLFGYLMRQPLIVITRAYGRREGTPWTAIAWLVIYGVVTASCGLAVIVLAGYSLLVVIGALALIPLGMHLYLTVRRADMTVVGELIGICGLALGAPALYYVSAGAPGLPMLGLWVLSVLYFGSTVFYVRLKARVHGRQDPPPDRLRRLLAGKTALSYHIGMLSLTYLMVASGLVPPLVPLAYVPAVCKAFQGVLVWRRPIHMRRLGITETVHSLIFAALLVLAYR